MVRNRLCVHIVPYDVNVTQSIFLTCVHVVPYDVSVTDVNVTVICLKSEELHETCTTKKCTTSKYFKKLSLLNFGKKLSSSAHAQPELSFAVLKSIIRQSRRKLYFWKCRYFPLVRCQRLTTTCIFNTCTKNVHVHVRVHILRKQHPNFTITVRIFNYCMTFKVSS